MTRTAADDVHPVLPGCEAWSSPGGGPHGALVLHGFTGSPVSVRPLAEAFAASGLAVEMPRLPGHGTHVDDMQLTGWDDWLAEAESALDRLRARCPDGRVVAAGLSMGGALVCALGVEHADLAGVIPINAPMTMPEGMADAVKAMMDGGATTMDAIGGDTADPDADEFAYDLTPLAPLASLVEAGDDLRSRLGEITMPVLVVTSRQDHIVNPTDSDLLAEAVSGPVERLWLERSYHVVTLDYDKAEVEAACIAFAEKVTAS